MADTVPIVYVVDDDVSVLRALELLISTTHCQARTFGSAEEFLSTPRPPVASCLLLDVHLPHLDGLALQERIGKEMPIIFITGYADVPTTVRAMKAGAVDLLTKPFRNEVLLDAICGAVERSSAALQLAAQTRALYERHASLTQREQEVMALVVRGQLNKQVGGALGISEITVKAHRGKVMRKMKARSLPDLVHMAATLGLS
jgi:FixJ family two-component response regulator